MKKSYIAGIAATLLVGAFAGAILEYQQQVSGSNAVASQFAERLEPDYAATMGDPNAKVTIVKFLDPACEACKAFHPLVKRIVDENPGKVRLVMRYAPLHAAQRCPATKSSAVDYIKKYMQI